VEKLLKMVRLYVSRRSRGGDGVLVVVSVLQRFAYEVASCIGERGLKEMIGDLTRRRQKCICLV